MEQEKAFPQGVIFKKPREGAPEFVRGSLCFKVDEFTKYLKENANNNWVNIDILKSKTGNTYLKLNSWKKEAQSTLSPEEKEAIIAHKAKANSVNEAQNEYNNIGF